MKILNDERIQKKILLLFLFIQPILDCYLLYTDDIISIFKFSPTTIIRVIFIGIMCMIVFFGKTDKKSKITISIYLLLIAIYSGVHISYNRYLQIENYDTFKFSTIKEALYILRMLLPFGMGYLAYSIKFTKTEIKNMIYTTLLLTSSIIIVSNILKISLPSYNSGKIYDNIFSWFSKNQTYPPEYLASKGWFNSANQISGLYMLLLPVALGFFFEKFSIPKFLIIFLTCTAMIILGTRVASYGWILNLLFILLVDIFFVVIWKKKINIKSILGLCFILMTCGYFLTKAPIVSALYQDDYYNYLSESEKNILDADNEENNGDENDNSISELVKKISIHPQYYTRIYPVENHEEFWYRFIYEIPTEQKFGQRNIQNLITKDVDQNQKTIVTPFIGYGYSRFTNAYLYLEHDFLVHFYTIGIFGIVLLLCPYIIICVASGLYMLFKKKMVFINAILAASILEVIAISIITGHIMDELIITIYLGFLTGWLIKRVKNNETEN